MANLLRFDKPIMLHILVYYDRSDRVWCAHCLDFNLVEDGNNPTIAENNLVRTIISYLKEVQRKQMKADEIFSPAPQFFWNLIMKSRPIEVKTSSKKLPFPYLTFKVSSLNVHETASL